MKKEGHKFVKENGEIVYMTLEDIFNDRNNKKEENEMWRIYKRFARDKRQRSFGSLEN